MNDKNDVKSNEKGMSCFKGEKMSKPVKMKYIEEHFKYKKDILDYRHLGRMETTKRWIYGAILVLVFMSLLAIVK